MALITGGGGGRQEIVREREQVGRERERERWRMRRQERRGEIDMWKTLQLHVQCTHIDTQHH